MKELTWEDYSSIFERNFYNGNIATDLWKYIPRKYHNAISFIDINPDGYWIYLNKGYVSYDGASDCGTIHEYTIDGIKKAVKMIRRGYWN